MYISRTAVEEPARVQIVMEEKIYSKYFKAFGEPSRLKILRLLTDKELTVNDIVDAIELSQSTVSRHLGVLREAGIVTDRRDGQQVFYSLNKGVVEDCCTSFCECLDIPAKSRTKKKK
jgi:ArsR family transcriptional regulator